MFLRTFRISRRRTKGSRQVDDDTSISTPSDIYQRYKVQITYMLATRVTRSQLRLISLKGFLAEYVRKEIRRTFRCSSLHPIPLSLLHYSSAGDGTHIKNMIVS